MDAPSFNKFHTDTVKEYFQSNYSLQLLIYETDKL